MKIGIVSSILFGVAIVGARAQDNGCTSPLPPDFLSPSDTMTQVQLSAGISAAQAYVDQAEEYRSCLKSELERERSQAKARGSIIDHSVEARYLSEIDNTKMREDDVIANVRAAINSY